MSRYSLAKIQGNLDLTHYFLAMEREFQKRSSKLESTKSVRPCDGADKVERIPYASLSGLTFEALSERLFGRVAPLELEIGTGKGLFISSTADANRDRISRRRNLLSLCAHVSGVEACSPRRRQHGVLLAAAP